MKVTLTGRVRSLLSSPARTQGPVIIGSSGAQGPTYQNVPLYPLRPGLKLDMEAFLKIRNKVRKIVAEELGTTTVSDDAVALVVRRLQMGRYRVASAASGSLLDQCPPPHCRRAN